MYIEPFVNINNEFIIKSNIKHKTITIPVSYELRKDLMNNSLTSSILNKHNIELIEENKNNDINFEFKPTEFTL